MGLKTRVSAPVAQPRCFDKHYSRDRRQISVYQACRGVAGVLRDDEALCGDAHWWCWRRRGRAVIDGGRDSRLLDFLTL